MFFSLSSTIRISRPSPMPLMRPPAPRASRARLPCDAGMVARQVTVNVLPTPSSLSTVSGHHAARPAAWSGRGQDPSPPASCRHPPGRTPRRSCPNRRQRCRCRCHEPRSRSDRRRRPAASVTFPPAGVNFTAFVSRLNRICLTFRSSPQCPPTESTVVMVKPMRWRVARSRTIDTAFSRSSASRRLSVAAPSARPRPWPGRGYR